MADLLYSCTQNSLEEPSAHPTFLQMKLRFRKQLIFGSKIAYRNRWVPVSYSVKFRDHEGQTRNFTPWRVLSLWSQHQGLHPGSFHRADGWITNPVTTHSRFREEDIEAAASCLQGLSTTVPPSPQVLNARIVHHAQQFRQRNYSAIRDRRLAPFCELAVHVWTHQTERIPNAPPLNHPQNNGSSFVLTPDLLLEALPREHPNVLLAYARLHHVRGPRPPADVDISTGGLTFRFHAGEKSARSLEGTPLNQASDVFSAQAPIDVEAGGDVVGFATSSSQFIAQREICLTMNDEGVYIYDEDQLHAGGYALEMCTEHQQHQVLSLLHGGAVRLRRVDHRLVLDEGRGIDRTRIALRGGAKAQGGGSATYFFDTLQCRPPPRRSG